MRNYTTPEKSSKRSPSRDFMPHTSPSLPIDAPLLHTADTPVKNRSAFAAAESTVCCVSSRAMMLVSVVVITLIVWLFGTSMPCETFHVLCANRCVRSVTSRILCEVAYQFQSLPWQSPARCTCCTTSCRCENMALGFTVRFHHQCKDHMVQHAASV